MGTSRPYALRPLLNPEHMRIGLANASARRKRWSKSHARITPGSIHQRMGVCRQRRYQDPHELIVRRTQKPAPSFDPNCPFCPGHENRTALEILRVPSLKGSWTLRVIPRKFNGMASEQLEGNSPGAVEGFGIHELIIETPDHSLTTALLPETQLLSLFRCAKSR